MQQRAGADLPVIEAGGVVESLDPCGALDRAPGLEHPHAARRQRGRGVVHQERSARAA